ncbi:YicC family protein [bacterium]|nr:YicC family protein [bacterium]
MSLTSMTGFGKAVKSFPTHDVEVEIRSVNHRYLDVSVRLPGQYSAYEIPCNEIVKKLLRRGKVDLRVVIAEKSETASGVNLKLDQNLFQQYFSLYQQAFQQVLSGAERWREQAVFEVLGRHDVISKDSSPLETQLLPLAELQTVLELALQSLLEMRTAEGKKLTEILKKNLSDLKVIAQKIEALALQSRDFYRTKLEERLKNFAPANTIDPDRLSQEVILAADRTDYTEEVDRLRSHFTQFEKLLGASDDIGKKLDFLCQEMHREFTTCGAKSELAEVSLLIVEAKSLLEKIREQVQNVE